MRSNNNLTPKSFEKSVDNYRVILSVLDLLIENSPRITEELCIVKTSITKWYDHIKLDAIERSREIFYLKENVII
jgi:hypothetical protein